MEKQKEEKKHSIEELAEKYNIDINKLEKEQEKLAKQISIKDSIDFSKIVKIGGISNVFFQNNIISAVVVINPDFELVEQKYFSDKARFPYIPGFRAYRELPAMVSCFNEIEEKPEVVFISGHGISHQRLGLASHFSLVAGIPAIGIADSLLVGEIEGENIVKNGKIVGKIIKTKEGSRPLYISPGNLISLDSAVKLVKKFIKEPYKLPEPLRLSHKYSREVMKELFK
ncbi:endonuclease V [Candidatus Pacearchaeota archaeon]|nr:endonuclease V [Candidatus Pacearchaeota archaeon]